MACIEERLRVVVRQCYGMTESNWISTASIENTKPGSVGKLNPNMCAKVVDGELYLSGPNVAITYYHSAEAPNETFTADGWLKTGDVCRIDQDGDIFIIDRAKDVRLYRFH